MIKLKASDIPLFRNKTELKQSIQNSSDKLKAYRDKLEIINYEYIKLNKKINKEMAILDFLKDFDIKSL